MRNNRIQFAVLVLMANFFVGCTGLVVAPNHIGKFKFNGKVIDAKGTPVANAFVKIRGWETITDQDGKWSQEQLVQCGGSRDFVSGGDQADSILVTAEGFKPLEQKFVVQMSAWFAGCETEKTIAFEAVKLEAAKSEGHVEQSTSSPSPAATPTYETVL